MRLSSLFVAVWLLGAACNDGDEGSSDADAEAAIAAYCQNAVKCGLDGSQEHCEWEWNLRFGLNFQNESVACRRAEIDEYLCFADVPCEELEIGCEDAEEAQSDACQP